MAPVQDQVFGARTPTYATILQLDRKLRAAHIWLPQPCRLRVSGVRSRNLILSPTPYAARFDHQGNESVPLSLVLLPFTDSLARFVIYAPRLLCAHIK
jgi:hypothetical protein